jgi:tetratricopeptide (TPR) repeat protein
LARLTGIPQKTITNWLGGVVKKPRSWSDLVKLARVLHLTEAEATELLQSAGHPSIETLLARADDEGARALLSPWADVVQRRLRQSPFQTIADFPHFVGRQGELQHLREVLLNGQQVTLYSLQGMGGVGKTVLAAHIAYELRAHFPDGVLWARVDTSDTMSILNTFAEAYGRDVSAHGDVESRSRVVRELLAGKRALMVLDNVQHSDQVRPLLPPSGTCAVIITTRRHDLSATRAAHRLLISPFSREKGEALELFAKVLGQDVVEREEVVLAEIAHLLGYLPLALDIAACRMAYEPDWSAADFVERLRQEERRLSELVYDDQSVRLSFNVSYEALTEEQRRFFAALSVFGGEDFGVEAAAYVSQTPQLEAEDHLRALYGLSLVQQGRAGRYRLHPLLRNYAREKHYSDEKYERMVAYFVRYVETHDRDYEALKLESDNILAALEVAYERGMGAELVRGANKFGHYLDAKGLYTLATTHLKRAEQVARAQGNTLDLAITQNCLGWAAVRRGDYAQAEMLYQDGLALAHENKNPKIISAALNGLGVVAFYRGDYVQAEVLLQQGLTIAREIRAASVERSTEWTATLRNESTFWVNLGNVYNCLGQMEQGIAFYKQALVVLCEVGYRQDEGLGLMNLGEAYHDLGQVERAIEHYHQALATTQKIGDPRIEGYCLSGLGRAYVDLGKMRQAIDYIQQALAIAHEFGDRQCEVGALSNLGYAYVALGQAERAVECYKQGLSIAQEIGDRGNEGNHLGNLGLACADLGQVEQAIEYLQRALAIAREASDRRHEGQWLSGLGKVCGDLRRWEEAIVYTEQAITIFEETQHPHTNQAREQLAWLCARKGTDRSSRANDGGKVATVYI